MRNSRIIVASISIFSIASISRADWGTYQGDAAHDGYAAVTVGTSPPVLEWSRHLSDTVTGLAVGGGTVLATTSPAVSTNIPSFFGIDQKGGSVLWSAAFPTSHSNSPPAYANGLAYLQTDGHNDIGGNYLHAYDARTGTSMFDAPYDSQWQTYASPTPFDGKIYAGGGLYGGMYAFGAQSGAVGWTATVPLYDNWTPAVDANYCYAFTTNAAFNPKGQLTIINRGTGMNVTSVVVPDSQWSNYLPGPGVVLGSRHDAYTADGGEVVGWDVALDANHSPHIVWTRNASFVGQPSLSHDVLYAVTSDHSMLALSALDGHTLWEWFNPNPLSSVYPMAGDTLVTDNVLFVTDSGGLPHGGGNVYAIDLSSGNTLWSYPVTGTLAFSDGTLFVGGQDGTVYALSVPEPAYMPQLLLGLAIAVRPRKRRVFQRVDRTCR